jgi:uncharacterized protein (TIGR03437 family)
LQSPDHGQEAYIDCLAAFLICSIRLIQTAKPSFASAANSIHTGASSEVYRMNHRQSRVFIGVLLSLTLLASLPLWTHYAQSAQSAKQKLAEAVQTRQANRTQETEPGAETDGPGRFVIVRGAHGIECRPLTPQEARALPTLERNVPLQTLGGEQAERLEQQQGLKINLRATTQLNNFPQAKAAFERAVAKWEAIIQSPITVVIDVDFGPTFFGTPYSSADIIGQTDSQLLLIPSQYTSFRGVLAANSSNQQQTAVYNALPLLSLPTDLGNTTNNSATSANLRALGVLPAVPNLPQEQAQGLGMPPAIGFNSTFAYDFDPSNGIDADKLDFEAAAAHEIGHALGFMTFMGFKELSVANPIFPTPWDLFRFRTGGLTLSSLGNRPRAQVSGGEQVFFPGGEEYGLSTGTPTGTGGDGQQGGHWKDDSSTSQYIGLMDPGISDGERGLLTAADLTALNFFGYRLNPAAKVNELLTASDNLPEERQSRSNALVVNRYTPARYPATLEAFRVYIPSPTDGSSPVGQQLRVVAFADPNRTGQPPANPSLVFDQNFTISAVPNNRVFEVVIANGPTINSGDLYVGVQPVSASVPIAADLNGRQQSRAFISTNNGQSWQALTSLNAPTPVPANFVARAVVSVPLANTAAPGALTLSPAAVAPGGAAFTLNVFGSNFQPNSVVRLNNNDRPTTYQSGALLQAQIPATDIAAAGTAKITVFTPASSSGGGGETVAVDLAITNNNPAPTLTRLDPPGGALGTSNLTLNVFGTNFNAQSRIRINGNERQTTLVNSTQLSTTLTSTDLGTPAALGVSVANPAPGGGASNTLNFNVVACSFGTSISGNLQIFSSTTLTAGAVFSSGFILAASNNVCPWNVSVSEPWVTLTSLPSGTGRSVISYQVQPQPQSGATPREARLMVGGQTVTLRQLGRAAAVSSASFNTPLAPESISSIFGTNIAKAQAVANNTPLPFTLADTSITVQDSRGAQRPAPLFFVSPGQNNFQIPQGTATGNGIVLIAIDGQLYADSRVAINSTAPGLFAANANGQGVAAAVILRVKADNSQSFEAVAEFNQAMNKFVARPIDFGPETDRLFLLLFGTGVRGRASLNSVALQIGGTSIPAQFAGPQGSNVGLDQINLELPRSLAGRGEVNITGTIDGNSINTVTMAFK